MPMQWLMTIRNNILMGFREAVVARKNVKGNTVQAKRGTKAKSLQLYGKELTRSE